MTRAEIEHRRFGSVSPELLRRMLNDALDGWDKAEVELTRRAVPDQEVEQR